MGDQVKVEGGTSVKCNVPVAEAINDEAVLPERVQEASGQLVGAAKEGLLALSVSVGLGVLTSRLDPAKPGEMSQVSGGEVELVDVGGDRLVESVEVAA